MINVGWVSWGKEARINLFKGIKYDTTIYFDSSKHKPTVLKIYDKTKISQCEIEKELAMMNYNTCRLCPNVRVAVSLHFSEKKSITKSTDSIVEPILTN